MKSKLAAALLAVGTSFACLSQAFATNYQGGEISYASLAPNTYQVNCKLFTDCSNPAPATATLVLRAPGCNTGRSVTLTKTGAPKLGNQYCAQIVNTCSPGGRENHEENLYTGTVTFSAAEVACPDWVLSVSDTSRTKVRNLFQPQQGLYLEASLNLANGLQNTAAKMNPNAPTVERVCVGQDTRLNFGAYDPDCDSLSYELVGPLSGPGIAYTYAPLTISSGFIVNPNPVPPYNPTTNPQLGNIVGVPGGYFSPIYPIFSYNANWNQINPATGIPYQIVPITPYFRLDSLTGEVRFRPAAYYPTPPAQGDNKYAVSVKVSEWRKLNGAMVKVGSVQHDVLFIVENCGGNNAPEIPAISANGQQINSGDIITVRPNAMLFLNFSTMDSDTGSTITLESDVTAMLPGAVFTQTSAPQPSGSISWLANGNGACGVRYFYLKVTDDNCPIKGKNVYVIGVRVSNSGTATGIAKETASNLHFSAFPNPFTDRVNFRFGGAANPGKSQILIYNSLGQEIDKINLPAGASEMEWQNANRYPAGNYVARLLSGNQPAQTIKFIRLR